MSSPGAPPRRAKRSDDRYGRRGQQPTHRQDGYTSSLFEEFSLLHVEVDRDFQETLDKRIAEQERLHLQALDQAKAEHERVRQGAERARELLELEIEKERARRELDEKRQLEAERKARLDRETAELTRQRQELERQEQEQRKRTAEEQAIQAARTRLEEEQRRQREEDERRQREQAEAQAKAQSEAEAEAEAKKRAAENAAKAQPPPAQSAVASNTSDAPPATSHTHPPAVAPPGPVPVNGTSPSKQSTTANPLLDPAKRQQREEIHAQCLALHKRLKVMRRDVFAQKNNFPDLKKNLGDWKRKIKSCFAQVTTDRLGHVQPLRAIQVVLNTASQFSEPSVDVSSLIISTPNDGSPMPMSGPLVFLLNTVAKAAISSFAGAQSEALGLVNPIAILVLTLFAKYRYDNKISLIDMLVAKYHFCCPVLWGIYGNEKTVKGRERIGWARPGGQWIPEQSHIDRMAGLGAGYAALALRDFIKVDMTNPYPPRNYWTSLSLIINTPPEEVQPTHCIVLKGLLVLSIPSFIKFYGQAAVVALRKALVEFPAQAPKTPARDSLMLMQETTVKELRLAL